MTITPLPTPVPQRSAPALFSARMDALLSALAVFVTETNALAVALNLSATSSVSTTSLTIATGTQTLTVEAAKSYQPGMSVKIAYTTTPTNWMHGDVVSYDAVSGVLVVAVTTILGSGTHTAWTVSFSAPIRAMPIYCGGLS